jgi:hypothetical protein
MATKSWELTRFPCVKVACDTQGNQVDSRLLMVGSQIVNLTPSLSFGHNLCFKCPNGSCKPNLDTYVPRAFQWYKELFNPLSFDPYNRPLKIWESTETPSPKVGVALGVWGFIPSHFLTLPGACAVIPGLFLGPQPCKPCALVASLRLRLRQLTFKCNHDLKFITTTNKDNKSLIYYIIDYITKLSIYMMHIYFFK